MKPCTAGFFFDSVLFCSFQSCFIVRWSCLKMPCRIPPPPSSLPRPPPPLSRLSLCAGEGRQADNAASNLATSPLFFFYFYFFSWQTGLFACCSERYSKLDHACRRCSRPLSLARRQHKRVNQLYRLWLYPTGLDNSQMSHVCWVQTPSCLAVSLPAGTVMWTPPPLPTPHPPLPSPPLVPNSLGVPIAQSSSVCLFGWDIAEFYSELCRLFWLHEKKRANEGVVMVKGVEALFYPNALCLNTATKKCFWADSSQNLNQIQWSIDPKLKILTSLVCQMSWLHLFSFDMHIHLVLSVKQEEASVTQTKRVETDGIKVIKTILVKPPNKWITKVNDVIIVYIID